MNGGGSREQVSISAVLVICDDATLLEDCLDSLSGEVDELVVVDLESTDAGPDLARAAGAMVLSHPRVSYVEPARAYGVSAATSDWVLVVDPDERPNAELIRSLRRIAATEAADVVMVPRVQVVFGRRLHAPGGSDAPQPRFFRRGALVWPTTIHAHPDMSGLRVHILPAAEREEAVMLHETWREPAQVLAKFGRYVEADAARRHAAGERYTNRRAAMRVARQSLGRMTVGRAYEDGVAGVLHAAWFGVYELAVQTELWRLQGKPDASDRWARRIGRLAGEPLRFVQPLRRALRDARASAPSARSETG